MARRQRSIQERIEYYELQLLILPYKLKRAKRRLEELKLEASLASQVPAKAAHDESSNE